MAKKVCTILSFLDKVKQFRELSSLSLPLDHLDIHVDITPEGACWNIAVPRLKEQERGQQAMSYW